MLQQAVCNVETSEEEHLVINEMEIIRLSSDQELSPAAGSFEIQPKPDIVRLYLT